MSGPFFNNGEARPPSGNRCSEDPTREKKQNASPNRRKNKAAVRQTSFTGVICVRTEAAGSSSVFSSWLYGVGCRADRRRQKLLLVREPRQWKIVEEPGNFQSPTGTRPRRPSWSTTRPCEHLRMALKGGAATLGLRRPCALIR